jgi:hypothetical protein
MDKELKTISKEVIMTEHKQLSRHLPGGTEGNHEKPVIIAGLQAEI